MTIPTRVSIEQINELLQGFYYANALKNAVSSRDAASRTRVSADVIGRNTGFLCDAGFLTKDGNEYRLTDLGAEYAQWLSWKNFNEASRILSKILKQYELADKIIHFVRLAGPIPKDDVSNRVGVLDRAPNTPHNRRGADTFVDLLIFSGLLDIEDDTIRIGTEKTQLTPEIIEQTEKLDRLEEKRPITDSRINITINIDSQTDPKNLRKIIKVLREELIEREASPEKPIEEG